VAEATATVSPTRLRLAGHLASHPYSLVCQQEFAIARAPRSVPHGRPSSPVAALSTYRNVKSKVGEFIHGMSRVTSVLDNTQVDRSPPRC
jgi:hypothetical protein